MVATRRKSNSTSGNDGNSSSATSDASIPDLRQMQQQYFDTGVTRSLAWRKEQLDNLEKLLSNHVQDWQQVREQSAAMT